MYTVVAVSGGVYAITSASAGAVYVGVDTDPEAFVVVQDKVYVVKDTLAYVIGCPHGPTV